MQKSKIILGICSLIVITTFFSCKKTNNSCKNYTPPNSLFFQVIMNGDILPDSILENLKMYYMKNGTKVYITDLSLGIEVFSKKGIMTTRSVGTLGANYYILEYENGLQSDTLYVDYSDATPATGCRFLLKKVTFNKDEITASDSFGYQPVYIFHKN